MRARPEIAAPRRRDDLRRHAENATARRPSAFSSRLPRDRGPAGAPTLPAASRSRARRMPSMSPGRRLPDADLDERADDRAHHLPAERGRRGSRSAARRRRRRSSATRARAARVVEPSGRLRQNAAKSCSPTNGSAPSRSARRSSGSATHHAYRAQERVGHGPVDDRVAVRRATAPSGGRRTPASTSSHDAHHDLGPEHRR